MSEENKEVEQTENEADKGAEKGIVHIGQRAPIEKEQGYGDHDKAEPIRDRAEHNGDGEGKEREIDDGPTARQNDFFRAHGQPIGGEAETADGDHGDGERKRREHDAQKIRRRDREVGIEIEILRIAERRQHAA